MTKTAPVVNRFIKLFSDAFEALNASVAMADIEKLSMMVHSTMDRPGRAYHTSSHLLRMCEGMNPRQVLATLFHDLVYVQLDGGFPAHADVLLRSVVRPHLDVMLLRKIPANDRDTRLCMDLFGFESEQAVPLYGGLNEFLSAVLAVRSLKPFLPWEELVAVVACIEATVPFRGNNALGVGPTDALYARVQAHAGRWGLALTPADMQRIIHDAVALANVDVDSFADAVCDDFLSNTWMLIDESNAPLRAVGVYSLTQYRTALLRMETFLVTVNPGHVFHRFAGQPNESDFAALCDATRTNLAFAALYLGAKIATVALVEALAYATGGDGPVSMFLGDIRSEFGTPATVQDYLGVLPVARSIDESLMRVLVHGRNKDSSNDLTASPLSAYVYRALGTQGMESLLADAKRYFKAELSALAFLQLQDAALVANLAKACARIALSRSLALESLAQGMGVPASDPSASLG